MKLFREHMGNNIWGGSFIISNNIMCSEFNHGLEEFENPSSNR